jgi:hypothetical protein
VECIRNLHDGKGSYREIVVRFQPFINHHNLPFEVNSVKHKTAFRVPNANTVIDPERKARTAPSFHMMSNALPEVSGILGILNRNSEHFASKLAVVVVPLCWFLPKSNQGLNLFKNRFPVLFGSKCNRRNFISQLRSMNYLLLQFPPVLLRQ